MSSALAPAVVQDTPPPFKTPTFTLSWPDDPEAKLQYALKPDTAYVVHIQRGKQTSGTQIMQAFQAIAEARRIKIIGVDYPTIGFWEKMIERKLATNWGMEDPKMLL